jgi:heme/copper-type cytochrome/quinol oxidase subunit 2
MNSPQQPMQTPQGPTEAPQSGGSLKWLLIVLVIVIIGAGLYWYFALR